MTQIGPDPFTKTYDAIWALLESNEQITTLVRLGNRIKFSSTVLNPVKETVQQGDLPELTIVPAPGGSVNFHGSSSSLMCEHLLDVVVSTGTLQLQQYMYPLKWAILQALAEHDNLGLDFVIGVKLEDLQVTFDNDEANRGTRGWSAVFRLNIRLSFQRKYLVNK